MKLFRYILLVVCGWGLTAGAGAQTVDQVINKHIDAMGGRTRLQALNSLYQEIDLSVMGGTVSMKNWQVKNKLWRMEVTFGTATTVTVVTPAKGWVYNPLNQQTTTMGDKEIKLSQIQLSTSDQLVEYATKGNKVELLSKDTVGKATCYRVRCTLPSGISLTYYIDVKTGFVLRQVMKGANTGSSVNASGESIIDYSDYRPESGYILPHSWVAGARAVKMTVTKVEINKPVDVAALSTSK